MLGKAVQFLITVFTKTSTVTAKLSKLTPGVLAAMLAVFYDVVKTAQTADAAVAAAQAGNIPSTFTLSETTLGLVKNVITDAKAAEQLVVADLKELGIIAA